MDVPNLILIFSVLSCSFFFSASYTTFFILNILVLIWIYFQQSYSYWKTTIGIPYVQPTFPFGNIKNIVFQKQGFGEFSADIYNQLKQNGHKYGGFFMFAKPMLCIVDPEIIKIVLLKDFKKFYNRGVYHNETFDPLSASLFALDGEKWQNLRRKFTPTFTSGKMKMMFQTLVACSEELDAILDKEKQKSIDIKDIAARFTTDVIGSCAFGVDCNSLKDPDVDFRINGKRIFNLTPLEMIKMALCMAVPRIMSFFKVHTFCQEIDEFFLKTIKETVDYRETNKVERNDFMNLLIKLKNNESISDENDVSKNEEGITLNQLAAQAFIFFIAGFETSSSVISFCFYELACNEDIQNELRKEINRVLDKYDGELTYEGVMEMTYMDKVINETLRKYPSLPMLNRQCTEPFTLPDSDAVIQKDTLVWIPVLGLHKDPEYYPNPELFDPERFSEENKAKIPAFAYLPFGEGPRNCIGLRFGLLQSKIGITALLKKHRYSLDERTPVPLSFNPKSVVLSAKDTIYLKCNKI